MNCQTQRTQGKVQKGPECRSFRPAVPGVHNPLAHTDVSANLEAP